MRVNWKSVVVVVLWAFIFSGGPVFAGASELAKQADKVIRSAERNMHNGKNEEADTLLKEALVILEQAKAADPKDRMTLRVDKKYGRLRDSVDRKLNQHSQKAPSPTSAAAPSPVGDKLPGGVSKRLKDISRFLNDAERFASRSAEKGEYKLAQAQELFDEIDQMYGGKFTKSNPEYAAVASRYKALADSISAQSAMAEQAQSEAKANEEEKKQQSAEWAAKFREYLSYPGQEGHNPDKLVYVPGTSEPEKFADAQKHYEAFKGFYAEYKNTQFPNGKTWQLESLGDDEAPRRLQQFEEEFSQRVGAVAGDAEQQINAAMAQLEKDNGWRTDKSIKPNLVDHKWMTSIKESTDKMISALGSDNPQAQQVLSKYDALVKKELEHRQIRKERTFMTPDRYLGEGIEELKNKARSLVKINKAEGGEPLRCTLVSKNWREERVEEWTDTSKTTWRYRTTRHLTAQVAAKTADGVRLITVALAKDQQADGSWGPLYGNLHQYSDPMLESNVFKDGD